MADRMQIAPRHRRILEALLRKHLPGVEVWAYGSRVNDRGHDGVDLDLVLRARRAEKVSSGLLPPGTVLLSSRAPIGYLAITEVPTAINQGFIAMICRKRLPALYVLSWCYENLEHIKDISGGSTFAEISKKAFRPLPVVVPPKTILGMYDEASCSLHERVVLNARESALLASLRDALLPKLVSGELRVRDAERLVGAIA